jgi:hypothetical protein
MKVLLDLAGIWRQNRIAEPNRDPLALVERPANQGIGKPRSASAVIANDSEAIQTKATPKN